MEDTSSRSSETSRLTDYDEEGGKSPSIGAKEHHRVLAGRALVFSVLLVSMALTGYLTYLYAENQEKMQFKADVSGAATRFWVYVAA